MPDVTAGGVPGAAEGGGERGNRQEPLASRP